MKSSEFRIACTSDIHLGHPKVSSEHTFKCIREAFPDNKTTSKLDMLIVAGDWYDRLLNLPQTCADITDLAIIYLLKLCAKHDIVLVVLEGTPSHDWKQPRRFVFLNEQFGNKTKLYYFDTLCIHHFTEFNLDFLFVPDEWTNSTEKTFKEVQQKLTELNLKKVDYAVMHGTFDYQLPMVAESLKHSSENYLGIVRYLIFVGHIHKFSRFDRIIAQGSLNRNCQNEEHPKGHVRVNVRAIDDYEILFVENKSAMIFKTINCTDLDLEQSYNLVDQIVSSIPDGSFIRIRSALGSQVLSSEKRMRERWPTLNWTLEPNERVENIKVEIIKENTYTPIAITRGNISRLVTDKMQSSAVDQETIKLASELLEKLLN